jgi:uncharacterized protein
VPRFAQVVWLLVCAVLLQQGGTAFAGRSYPQMTERVIDTYVVPRFDALAQASASLHRDLEAACQGTPGGIEAARTAFKRTVLAWAGVEFLRFGPMAVTGRPERFSFWPDTRGVMLRQLRGVLARRDPDVLEPQTLAKKSAAIQGLPALEFLLWNAKHPLGPGGTENQTYRCALAVAIAGNLSQLAGELAGGWDGDGGWRRRMLDAGPENPRYKSETEPPADFARALITGLRMIQDWQVVPLMEAEEKPGKRPRLPFMRSGLSAAYLSASIDSVQALYKAMRLADDVPRDKVWMPQWITQAFARLEDEAPSEVQLEPVKKQDPERARKLRFLRFHVNKIRTLVGRELAPLAGLMIGFNELDGD